MEVGAGRAQAVTQAGVLGEARPAAGGGAEAGRAEDPEASRLRARLLPAEVKRAHGTPPPVSPKPPPPPTAPKPAKAAAGLPSGSASPSPAPSPARQPPAALAKPASTPPSLSASPAKPPSPGAPALHAPAKPPRAAATGSPAAPDGPSPGDSARQKLEETSACLAAALQAVEEKIRQEDAQGPRLPAAEEKSTGSILDDIGSMFDDLADQLDAMLE